MFLTVYYTSGLRRAGHDTGDWSNGMIGVSKTFGGSSILSSPVLKKPWKRRKTAVFQGFYFCQNVKGNQKSNQTYVWGKGRRKSCTYSPYNDAI